MLNLWGAWVGVAILLAAGMGAWVGARALLRTLSVPFLLERVFDYLRAVGFAVWLGLVVAVATTRLNAVVGFALMLLVSAAAVFPLRAPLYQERWNLARYLLFQARVIVAFYGFWMFMAMAPSLVVAAAPASRWTAAYATASAILLWSTFHAPLMAVLVGGRALRDVGLKARFDAIVARAGAPRPVVLEISPRDGSFWNAFAMPGRPPLVLFGGSLAEALTPEEATAVFAHELAHVEQAAVRRWQRVVGWLVILAGVFACAAAARFRPSGPEPGMLWAVAVGFTYRRMRGNRQPMEVAADQRAAELCGDPALVARALTRLHAFARLPRRWTAEHEAHASHPDLAARVAALQLGEAPPAAPPVIVPFAEPAGAALAVDEAACHWLLEHEPTLEPSVEAWRSAGRAFHSFKYPQIELLTIAPSPAAIHVELATTAGRMSGVIAAGSVAMLEQALEALGSRVRVRHQSAFRTASAILRGLAAGAFLITAVLIGLVLLGLTLSL